RLGHREAGTDAPLEKRLEPLSLLRLGAVALGHLPVAGVGGRTVEHFWSEWRAAHDLAERRILEISQGCASLRIRQEQVPEARGLRLGLQLLHYRRRLPPIAPGDLLGVARFVRIDELIHEVAEPFLERAHLRRILEIHAAPPGCMVSASR